MALRSAVMFAGLAVRVGNAKPAKILGARMLQNFGTN